MYERIFEKPYPDGYEDLPLETTPVTARTLNDKDDALEHIEDYLETVVEANPTLEGTEDSLESISIEGIKFKVEGGGGGGTTVIANPTLSGTEDDLNGLQVGSTKYKVATVEANPTLAGTESDLTAIKIGDTKYKVPSGGGGGGGYNLPADNNPIVVGKFGTKDLYCQRFYTTGAHTSYTSIGSIPNGSRVVQIDGCFYGSYSGQRIIGPLLSNYGGGWENNYQFLGDNLQVTNGANVTEIEIYVYYYME